MKKRFTDCGKWRDPWFHALSPTAKLLFLWLCDNADNAGVIDFHLKFATFDIGQPVEECHIAELGDRLKILENGKLWIPKFIAFQCGPLSEKCTPHIRILELLNHHGINYTGNKDLSTTLPSRVETTLKEEDNIGRRQEKEEDRKGESVREGENLPSKAYHPNTRIVLHLVNEASGKHYREIDSNLSVISARLKEPEVDLDGVRVMIEHQAKKWKGTKDEFYLRPETLFGKQKFDGYYATRNDKIIDPNQTPKRNVDSNLLQEKIKVRSW